ncbi:MAG TPA: FtsQ-type POTRA domain-containing protein, partial [Coriobacteriia bacterium]|nr:FtsQ-type POTRA domain-containing protein [Coriobacteriia bacterium]
MKRDERERRRRTRLRRARLRSAVIIISVVALLSGAIAIYRSQVFDIRDVEVLGTDHVSVESVVTRAEVPHGATLLRYPSDAIKERVTVDPWIADATITRDFPHTLRIRVEERVARAIVDTGAGALVVDGHGFVIAEHAVEETTTLPVVRDTPGLDLKVGRKSTSEVLANALAVIGGMGAELAGRVASLSARSIDETMLITADKIEILIGPATEMEKKRLIVEQILRDQ